MVSEETVREQLRQVTDPDLGINIVDLGLIYGVEIEDNTVFIRMTLTTPACPFADALMEAVRRKAEEIEAVADVKVDLTFEPSWKPEMMSAEARDELGMLTGMDIRSLRQ